MDNGYATTALFKQLMQAGKFFYCPLKSNRLVDDSDGQQPYQPLALLSWSAADVAQGKLLKVRGMPQDSKLKLFRVLVSTHRTDYLLTNELAQDDTQAAEQESNVRWLSEQFHREAKQLTGLQACQYRLANANPPPTMELLVQAYRPVMPAGPQPTQPHRPGPAHLDQSQAAGEPGKNDGLSTQTEPSGRLYAS